MKFKTLRTITSHPLTKNNKCSALIRFFKRGILVRLCPYPVLYTFAGSARLLVERGMSSAELQIYTGLYDFHEMLFLLHALNQNDLFVDVGANTGVYSILASKVKGSRTISIEPLPETFQHLMDNIAVNHITERVKAYNMGAGAKKGYLKFTKDLNSAINHVEISGEENREYINIPVNTLDNILEDENPFIIKIDVEGYESMVIKGAGEVLKKDSLKAIIIELNNLSRNYGFNDDELHQTIISYGFEPYFYQPSERNFRKLNYFEGQNTIYIRDIEFVKKRVAGSPGVKVFNREY